MTYVFKKLNNNIQYMYLENVKYGRQDGLSQIVETRCGGA